MASCRDINDCTIVSCAIQQCTDVARNISTFESNLSAFPADFKLYRRAMARLNIVQSRRATTTTIIIHYQL